MGSGVPNPDTLDTAAKNPLNAGAGGRRAAQVMLRQWGR
jgi:hypothetical protein